MVELVVKNVPTIKGDTTDVGSISVRKIPWRREWLPTSSILAWRISWTEEAGGLESMRSQRVGHD